MSLVVSTAESTKDLIRRWPGKLPAYRWALLARRAYRIPALVRVEKREAARALRQWGARPVASTAILIPTYRRPRQVVEAVESVLAQTVSDFVVVVNDDGQGLPTLPDDPRVYSYSLSANVGVAGVVRNVGIRSTASRYLAFLDDDNVWLPNHLEVSLAAHRAGAELTYTALRRRRPDGSEIDVLSVPFDRAVARERGFADTNTIVVRRKPHSYFSRLPLQRGDFPLEDWEFVYRLSASMRTEHIDTITAEYLVSSDSSFTDWEGAGFETGPSAP